MVEAAETVASADAIEPAEPAALLSSGYYQNPYHTFAWLRDNSPVHEFRFPAGDVRMWIVTRYEDVRSLLGDPRFSSAGGTWGSAEFKEAGLVSGAGSVLERAVTVVDPPDHTRLRRLAMRAFTPRRVAEWREIITKTVTVALDRCQERGRFDVMQDYGGVVSAGVMGEILGFRIDRYEELVETLAKVFPSDPALMERVPEGMAQICEYAEQLVTEKRGAPGDDLVSDLIKAEEAGDRLSREELVAMVAAMILAGSDTIRAFVGNAVLALIDHPDQAALLRARPDLAPAAVEELLRYEGALSTTLFRLVTEDLELNETKLPAGAPVIAAILSGNRDPRQFDDPDRLDITRTDIRHLGLGHGLHNCLGAALARLEAEIAIPALFERFPGLTPTLPRAEIRYIDNWAMRRIERLPVTPTPTR